MRSRSLAGAAVAAASLSLFVAGAAKAADGSVFPPNYTFGDGSQGFKLVSRGGAIDPGVVVSFNPPGDGADGLLIALLDPADPQLISTSTGGSFNFLIGLLLPAVIPGDGSVLPLPAAPDINGRTGFRDVIGGHDISVSLQFGPGPVDPGSWVGFNPQPDPPGDVLKGSFQFANRADPWMSFSVSVDGAPLTFALDNSGVPEPAAWALMIAGFGGVGATLRARRRRPLAA